MSTVSALMKETSKNAVELLLKEIEQCSKVEPFFENTKREKHSRAVAETNYPARLSKPLPGLYGWASRSTHTVPVAWAPTNQDPVIECEELLVVQVTLFDTELSASVASTFLLTTHFYQAINWH